MELFNNFISLNQTSDISLCTSFKREKFICYGCAMNAQQMSIQMCTSEEIWHEALLNSLNIFSTFDTSWLRVSVFVSSSFHDSMIYCCHRSCEMYKWVFLSFSLSNLKSILADSAKSPSALPTVYADTTESNTRAWGRSTRVREYRVFHRCVMN